MQMKYLLDIAIGRVKEEDFSNEFKNKMKGFGIALLKNIFNFENYEKLIGEILI